MTGSQVFVPLLIIDCACDSESVFGTIVHLPLRHVKQIVLSKFIFKI